MSTLPTVDLPRDSVEIGNTEVKFRSLSRAECLKVTTQFKDNVDGAENYILACGCDISEEDAAAWRQSVDVKTAGTLVDAIIVLSGLSSKT